MGTGEGSRDDREPSTGSASSAAAASGQNLMELRDCIQDSPNFRLQLKQRELEIQDLEMKLEKVVNTCDQMVRIGNSYTEACRSFSVSIKELSTHFKEFDEVVSVSLRKFYEALSELQSYYSILFDQAQRSVQSSLRAYLSGELRKVKETKRTFHKISDELTSAINRNSHAPKSKPQEADEASSQLVTIQNMFSHHAIDYGYQINTINCTKGYEILHNLLAFMHSQATFFHQGYDLLQEFDPFMKSVAGKVDNMRKKAAEVAKEMDSRHSLVTPKNLEDSSTNDLLNPMENPSSAIEMSGYLFKRPRGGSNIFKSWSRRWFILRANKLVYQSGRTKEEDHVTVAEDLRICTVKLAEDLERRFCFEVVTPSRSCMLQADSEMLRKKWLAYLEAGIARALRISASNKKKEDMMEFNRRSVEVSKGPPIHLLSQSPTGGRSTTQSNYSLGFDFLEAPGNDTCADCSGSKPTWASINLGIMLCIECSGIHRGLGVHISKVRSVQLDDWELELQKIMCWLGNSRVNAIFEYDIPSHIKKPSSDSPRSVRETYIRMKYIEHAFVHPHPDFKRPEIPVPPLSIPELLAPSKTPLAIMGGSPKSPHKRSFSPGIKIRSPKTAMMSRFSRPSSAASSITDQSSLNGSEEDLRKSSDVFSRSCEPASGLHLLAENFRKQEKEREKAEKKQHKGSWNLGDKLKLARRSSKKISNYAMAKFGEGQESIRRRLKRGSKDTPAFSREAHSDTEEDNTSAQNTPLLFSMSASTHNLTLVNVPPPKPPRTFKTKDLCDLALNPPDSDEEKEELPTCPNSADFSSDVLSAISEMSTMMNSLNGKDCLANGSIPSANTSDSTATENGGKMLRSESSPQLSAASGGSATPLTNGKEPSGFDGSPRLQTISEHADGPSSHTGAKGSSEGHTPLTTPTGCPVFDDDNDDVDLGPFQSHTDSLTNRLVQSVPLRTKKTDPPPSSSLPLTSPDELFLPPLKQDSLTVLPSDSDDISNKRFSMLSTTSAEYFSAESSGESKPGSPCPSPEMLVRSSILPMSPVHLQPEEPRNLSSQSDENFNTPPSSPFSAGTPSPDNASKSATLVPSSTTTSSATLKREDSTSKTATPTPTSTMSSTTPSPSHVRMGSDTLKAGAGMRNGPMVVPPSPGEEHVDGKVEADGEVYFTVKEVGEEDSDPTPQQEKEIELSTAIATVGASQEKSDKSKSSGSEDAKPEDDEPLDPSGSLQSSVSEAFSSEVEDSPTPVHTVLSLPKKNRVRSLTVSNEFSTLPVRGKSHKAGKGKVMPTSRDDNFDTEFKHDDEGPLSVSDGMTSYFSQQDLEDIFKVGSTTKSIIADKIDPLKEMEGEEGNEGKEEGVVKEEEEAGKGEGEGDDKEEEPSSSVESSHVGSPEQAVVIEPVIIPDDIAPTVFLLSCVCERNLPGILCALAHGANINHPHQDHTSQTPVLKAVEMGDKVLLEYLYQNGGKLLVTDAEGRGCLHLAAMGDDPNLVMMLLKRGARPRLRDSSGKDPLTYALEKENGDIVTMLRMAKFRAETQSADDRQSQSKELEGEYFQDIKVASLVDSNRLAKRISSNSLEGSTSSTSRDSVSRDSRETQN